MPKKKIGVAAVERAMSIIDAFRDNDGLLTLEEISKRTKLYKSTILRLLETLEARGLIKRTEAGLYHIGYKALRLAKLYQDAVQPSDIILPALKNISRITGESASYNIVQKNFRVCVYRVDSPRRIRDNVQPGELLPVDRGAAGHIFAAFAKNSHAGLVDRGMLAFSVGELDKETAGVAAPVFGPHGDLAGAIAISGPRTRFDKTAVTRMQQLLLEAAIGITGQLGGDTTELEVARKALK